MNKRTINWVLINGGFAAAMYLGYYEGIDGAKNVALMIAWVTIVMSLGALSGDAIKLMREKGRTVPQAVGAMFDTAVVCVLAWYGETWTAGFYAAHAVVTEGAWQKAEGKA